MDPSEVDVLVRRLVANPHDEQALSYAHQQGAADPKAYALFLERVGNESTDPTYACHWLTEAANVWTAALGDAHRAARALMQAIDRDPTQRAPAERLADLYRDKSDAKGLLALYERRVKALAPIATEAAIRSELAAVHEDLGRLWHETFSQPRKALENFLRAMELDPKSMVAIYSAREIYKAQGELAEAIPLYQAEVALEPDATRKLALLRDEAAIRREVGDLIGATETLSRARQIDPNDPVVQQEFASLIIERMGRGEDIARQDKTMATELLVGLAESYDGEHGLAYAAGALDIEPGHDRALQLFVYYARALQRANLLTPRYVSYLQVNPNGDVSPEARHVLAQAFEADGRFDQAIDVLEPLRALGDAQAQARLRDLYTMTGAKRLTSEEAPRGSNPGAEAMPHSRRAPVLPPEKLQGALDAAQMFANKGKKEEALAKYQEILDSDPAHPEALAWVEDYLRSKREYSMLRDVLLAAVRAMPNVPESLEGRKERLREVAGLCEGNLREIEGAVSAWKQLIAIDRADEAARNALTRLLERTQRWDDLANLLEQEATAEPDTEKKIALEKKLASMQETKRRDLIAAAEAWTRIARLTADDDRALVTASKLFERAGNSLRAAEVISEGAQTINDTMARGVLLERMAELREVLNDPGAAGQAYADAAGLLSNPRLWEASERCFVGAEQWQRAADAADHRAQMSSDSKQEAQHVARAAEHMSRAGDEDGVLERLERATHLDPTSEEYAAQLSDRYTAGGKWDRLAKLLATRGDRMPDRAKRAAARRQAAHIYATQLNDKEAAREQWLKVLEEGDDREALEKLVDDAVARADHTEATTLLRRLANTTVDRSEKARVALREAELLAEGVGDIDTAIMRYESILCDLDSTCRPALQAIADLQETRGNWGEAADALERELKLIADVQERGQIAVRLARLYDRTGDARNAIRALDLVRKADVDNYDALARLRELCEKTEQWDRVAEILSEQIEIEADDNELAAMTQKLARILADRLDRGDEALATLTDLADQGHPGIRAAYIELGDRLGWKGVVATKLVDWWFQGRHGPERIENLKGAFARFAEVGRDQDAVRVGIEIVRAKGSEPDDIAEELARLSLKTGDLDALAIAHELLVRELSGVERASELVRQAEARVQGGGSRIEAVQHGEAGLVNIPPVDLEPLLERLAQLCETHADVVDLYERQISRSRSPADRVRALGRAAQVAANRGQFDRARNFFELGLAGSPSDEALATLEVLAREADEKGGSDRVLRLYCSALSCGGHGARDGGRTRAALLRRAASIAFGDLNDIDQAFAWIGDALIVRTEPLTLDTLEHWGTELREPGRVDVVLSRALGEVFDGPLVKQLLARRVKVRRDLLGDKAGAAADLKKLHDLAPQDSHVMEELSHLLGELGDYRGIVQLYEDQILRGRDINLRADLARIVARIWEEQLKDPHEAADAWRRVLRMRPHDPEATQGLERAKSHALRAPVQSESGDPYSPQHWPTTPPSAPPSAPPGATQEWAEVPTFSEPGLQAEMQDIMGRAALSFQKDVPDSQGRVKMDSVVLDPVTGKPTRPDIAFRRSSPEEVTMSSSFVADADALLRNTMPEYARQPVAENSASETGDVFTFAVSSNTLSGTTDELAKTGETAQAALGQTGAPPATTQETTATEITTDLGDDDLIVIADDMTDIIDVADLAEKAKRRKRQPPQT